jgi:stringent starvation protein B
MQTLDTQSTRPYLLRAIYEWCTDMGYTPYLAVYADASVQVPREYVRNNEIVLNISFDATSDLQLGNEFVEFKARFGGVSREIIVPVGRVIAIYALENGQGMAFPVQTAPVSAGPTGLPAASATPLRKGLAASALHGEAKPRLQLVPSADGSHADGNPDAVVVPDDNAMKPSASVTPLRPAPADDEPQPPPSPAPTRPTLTRVK